MTALTRYARLEATALWRATPDAQRQEVIVSIGDATLIISNFAERPLTHWSLAAIDRANPGQTPAIYHPDGDPGETLELAEDEEQMIAAIEQLRRAIHRSRPRPGRLRWASMASSVAIVLALVVFWLPAAMRDHTVRVVPDVKRVELGLNLLSHMERISGPACNDTSGRAALALLSKRLSAGKLAVLPDMTRQSLHLPGALIVLDRALIEQFEEPDVAAGYVLSEMARRRAQDPLHALLRAVGPRETFRLLTTGEVSDAALKTYAEQLMTAPPAPLDTAAQLDLFAEAEVRSTPYAYARDSTGETTLPLIEADPMTGKLTEPLMTDANWLRLQNICGA